MNEITEDCEFIDPLLPSEEDSSEDEECEGDEAPPKMFARTALLFALGKKWDMRRMGEAPQHGGEMQGPNSGNSLIDDWVTADSLELGAWGNSEPGEIYPDDVFPGEMYCADAVPVSDMGVGAGAVLCDDELHTAAADVRTCAEDIYHDAVASPLASQPRAQGTPVCILMF